MVGTPKVRERKLLRAGTRRQIAPYVTLTFMHCHVGVSKVTLVNVIIWILSFYFYFGINPQKYMNSSFILIILKYYVFIGQAKIDVIFKNGYILLWSFSCFLFGEVTQTFVYFHDLLLMLCIFRFRTNGSYPAADITVKYWNQLNRVVCWIYSPVDKISPS